jgi:hypothetical protein
VNFYGSAGGSFLGASVKGNYAKTVSSNNDVGPQVRFLKHFTWLIMSQMLKVSSRTSFRKGMLSFSSIPTLSTAAFAIRENRKGEWQEPSKTFANRYGDYYVAGLVLGGDNATVLSSSLGSVASSELSDMLITGRIFGIKASKTKRSRGQSQHDNGAVNLTYMDSLANRSECMNAGIGKANNVKKLEAALERGRRNIAAGGRLNDRVGEVVDQIGLKASEQISYDMCERVSQAGLVTEILLLPYSGLREYVVACTLGP